MNLKKDIMSLDLDDKIIDKLKNNNILIVEDLWKLKRIELKQFGIKDSEINKISIKLELLGIGLNKKVYEHDRLK